MKWRVSLKLGLDRSKGTRWQRPANGVDPALREAGAPQGHAVQPRAEIGVSQRPEQFRRDVQNNFELRGPWHAVQTGRGAWSGPAKALFGSEPAIRQLPDRRKLVIFDVG